MKARICPIRAARGDTNTSLVPDSIDRAPSVEPDRPDLLIFPPILPNGGLAAGLILEWILPIGHHPEWFPSPVRWIAGPVMLAIGLTIFIGSHRAMRQVKTNVNPRRPALALAQAWPFTWTRNPMYLGTGVMFIGAGLTFHLYWMLIFYPAMQAVLHYGIVLREERYLARKFGQPYVSYTHRVRRWL